MTTVLIIVGWACMAWLAYILVRYIYRRICVSWTVGTRRIVLVVSLFGGPFAVVTALLVLLAISIPHDDSQAWW